MRLLEWIRDVTGQLDLEELIGMTAFTTFLVGFSTVRLQAKLDEWRQSSARVVTRILEQNAGEDLLPLPGSILQHSRIRRVFDPRDELWRWTTAATWLTFIISSTLIGLHWYSSVSSANMSESAELGGYVLVQIIHLAIVFIGTFGPRSVKRTVAAEELTLPLTRYQRLEECLASWLTEAPQIRDVSRQPQDVTGKVLENCGQMDQALPDWCWTHLIRGTVDLTGHSREELRPQLQRIRDLSTKTRVVDEYSLIAFVWSHFLLEPNKASISVRHHEIQSILEFSSRLLLSVGRRDVYALMALGTVLQAWESRESQGSDTLTLATARKLNNDMPLAVLREHLRDTRFSSQSSSLQV